MQEILIVVLLKTVYLGRMVLIIVEIVNLNMYDIWTQVKGCNTGDIDKRKLDYKGRLYSCYQKNCVRD